MKRYCDGERQKGGYLLTAQCWPILLSMCYLGRLLLWRFSARPTLNKRKVRSAKTSGVTIASSLPIDVRHGHVRSVTFVLPDKIFLAHLRPPGTRRASEWRRRGGLVLVVL